MLLRRLLLVVVPAMALVAFVLTIPILAPTVLNAQTLVRPEPKEPLLFDHSIHVKVVGLDCTFCHRSAAKGMAAGYPDVQQCMFCHNTIGQGTPEIEKVRTAWVQQQPIEWERVHRMPDHVHFVHEAHIKAFAPNNPSDACVICHGDVRDMSQVRQVRALNMGDCVNCHRQNQASTECVTCHY